MEMNKRKKDEFFGGRRYLPLFLFDKMFDVPEIEIVQGPDACLHRTPALECYVMY